MANPEQTINEYLQRMGLGAIANWQATPNTPPGVSLKSGSVSHMGVNLGLILEVGTNQPPYEILQIDFGIGYVPKTNIAPLFRTLLARSGQMGGAFFYLNETTNVIGYKVTRYIPGMDFAEFKQLMDLMGSLYWPVVNPIVQQFQISQKPT